MVFVSCWWTTTRPSAAACGICWPPLQIWKLSAKLHESDVTFVSKPARDGVEFLASDDPWFRAVNLEDGPDGALYVVDMYRAVIEHPQFVPDELKQRPDLRYGDDRGRIYRITESRDASFSYTRKDGTVVEYESREGFDLRITGGV